MEAGGSGGGGGGGETILIRGVWAKDKGYDECTRRCYYWSVFHKVDLKNHKLEEDCLPRLQTWHGLGEMVLAPPSNKLYVIGGETQDLELQQRAFVLDVTNDNKEKTWEPLPLPIPKDFRLNHNCASLDGKIYHYAYRCSKVFALAMAKKKKMKGKKKKKKKKKKGGFWKFIWSPPELDGRDDFREAGPLVADPANKRILVCTEGGLLYAYYPQDGTMKLIRDGLFIWSDAVVLVDDVVYVHLPTQHLIHAFDVSDEGKGKPLEVRWSTMVVGGLIDDDGLPVEIDLCCYEFEALLHLGNNNFCFATWRPWESDTTLVHFVKFSAVVHCGTGLIVCTPLTLQEHLLHSTIKALDFV